MVKLLIDNLFQINPRHGLSKEELSAWEHEREPAKIATQGFHDPIDKETLDKIKNFKTDAKHIVVLGIGGSALGTLCLKQSLGKTTTSGPKLHVLDNIDPNLISELEADIDYKKTLFIVVTKSGTTPETLAQYHYFKQKSDNFVFIGGFSEPNAPHFEIPENIGGRFSVLTAVGLLPAHLIGIDIDKLLAGARTANAENAATLATIQYQLSKKGKNINVLMPYSQKLIRLADWYRQLLAESIGKRQNKTGKVVNVGLTPVSALGVTDQHSQIQLYNEGPNDKLIIFIEVDNLGPELQIPGSVTFNKLMQIEKKATEISLTKNDRPNITIKVDSISEETVGELLMTFMRSIAYLGELFGINAYDQPGVELGKKLTRELLAKS